MKVLGITTEGDGAAAIVEDGRILSAANEERLSRMRLVVGFLRRSIKEVLELSNTDVGELDAVFVAARNSMFVDRLEPFNGWPQLSENGGGNLVKRGAAKMSRFRDNILFLGREYYVLLETSFWQRRRSYSMDPTGGVRNKLSY